MKNKNIVIILCLFLAIAIAGAVFVFNKPAKPEKPGNNNNQQTSIQENIKEEIKSDVPVVDEERVPGNKTLPVIVDGVSIGEADIVIKNATFYTSIDSLNNLGVTDFKKNGDTFVWETEDSIYTISEKSVIFYDKLYDIHKADLEEEAKNNPDGNYGQERKFDIEGYKEINGKYYLAEESFSFLFIGYINNKGISINNNIDAQNSSYIETFIRTNNGIDLTDEEITSLADAIGDIKGEFTVSGDGEVRKDVLNDEIIDIFANSIQNEENVLYAKKYGNEAVVMFNDKVASAIMNAILGSISSDDIYVNVRVYFALDDDGKINDLRADTYYLFDSREIYYYITLKNN